jgi:hypothetical protein
MLMPPSCIVTWNRVIGSANMVYWMAWQGSTVEGAIYTTVSCPEFCCSSSYTQTGIGQLLKKDEARIGRPLPAGKVALLFYPSKLLSSMVTAAWCKLSKDEPLCNLAKLETANSQCVFQSIRMMENIVNNTENGMLSKNCIRADYCLLTRWSFSGDWYLATYATILLLLSSFVNDARQTEHLSSSVGDAQRSFPLLPFSYSGLLTTSKKGMAVNKWKCQLAASFCHLKVFFDVGRDYF